MIQCWCGSVICLKHCFQSRDGWKLSKGKVFCWEVLIQWVQNLPCKSIALAGISLWIKTIGFNCLKSWKGWPLFRTSTLLKVQFEMEDFNFDLNTLFPFSSLGGKGPCNLFPCFSCSSAHVRSQSSLSRWQRIKSSPKDSLCGCMARPPHIHTGRLGWQGPWLGRAGCSDLPQSCRCSFPRVWHLLSAWLGTPVSPSHCLLWAWSQRPLVPSVGRTGEGHDRLAGSDCFLPCACNKWDSKFCASPHWSPPKVSQPAEQSIPARAAGSLI